MELHLEIIGSLLTALALVHVIFPSYFKWKTELPGLSLMNRQMMQVHTFFIALTVFLMGLLCLTSAPALVETELGQKICFGLGIFWFMRLIVQLFGYSSKLWRGIRWKTGIHVLSIFLWIYASTVFFIIFMD